MRRFLSEKESIGGGEQSMDEDVSGLRKPWDARFIAGGSAFVIATSTSRLS